MMSESERNYSRIFSKTNPFGYNFSSPPPLHDHREDDVITFMEKCLFAPKKEQKWPDQLEKITIFVYCSELAHYIF